MDATYWHKQTVDKPLFPDLQWSRPENRRQAGRLLIVGGHLHGFIAPAQAYQASLDAGVGTVRVLLPDALRKTVGSTLDAATFAPSTPSGSFSRAALADLLDQASWAEAILLAGDTGRNSETAVLIESLLSKYTGKLIIAKDAADYLYALPAVLERPNTLLVLSLSQLQKLTTAAKAAHPVTFKMDLIQLVEYLRDFTLQHQIHLITRHLDHILIAVHGQVSTTKVSAEQPVWRVETAAKASV